MSVVRASQTVPPQAGLAGVSQAGPPAAGAMGYPSITINVNSEGVAAEPAALGGAQGLRRASVTSAPTPSATGGQMATPAQIQPQPASTTPSAAGIRLLNRPPPGVTLPDVDAAVANLRREQSQLPPPPPGLLQSNVAQPHAVVVPLPSVAAQPAPVLVGQGPIITAPAGVPAQSKRSFWTTPGGIIILVALAVLIGLAVFLLVRFVLDQNRRNAARSGYALGASSVRCPAPPGGTVLQNIVAANAAACPPPGGNTRERATDTTVTNGTATAPTSITVQGPVGGPVAVQQTYSAPVQRPIAHRLVPTIDSGAWLQAGSRIPAPDVALADVNPWTAAAVNPRYPIAPTSPSALAGGGGLCFPGAAAGQTMIYTMAPSPYIMSGQSAGSSFAIPGGNAMSESWPGTQHVVVNHGTSPACTASYHPQGTTMISPATSASFVAPTAGASGMGFW